MLVLALWQTQRAFAKYALLLQTSTPITITEITTANHLNSSNTQNQSVHSTLLTRLKSKNRSPDNNIIIWHPLIEKNQYFIINPAIKNHQAGVSLLALSPSPLSKHYLVIDLGWFDSEENAQKSLKKYSSKAISSFGRLYHPSGRLLRHPALTKNWPKALGFIDLARIEQALDHPIYPQILVTENAPLYTNIANHHTLWLGITRHICYALQFIAFGLIGLYTCKKRY